MRRIGGVLGIIAGLIGLTEAVGFLLFFGPRALVEGGLFEIAAITLGMIVYSVILMILGASAFLEPKSAGLALIVCSIGIFAIAVMVLGGPTPGITMARTKPFWLISLFAFLGGLLAVFSRAGVPPFVEKPWSTGRLALYTILSLLIPIIGLFAGIRGLLSDAKRRQGALLLVLCMVGATVYAVRMISLVYVDPGAFFMKSELMLNLDVREGYLLNPGFVETGLTVEQFVGLLQKAVMDNGKSPQIKGWTKERSPYDYTLHAEMKQPVHLRFRYNENEQVVVLGPVQVRSEQMTASQFFLNVIVMVPEDVRPKLRPRPAASGPEWSVSARPVHPPS
jgi:hypothetical protein